MTPQEFGRFVEEYSQRVDRVRQNLQRQGPILLDEEGMTELGSTQRQEGDPRGRIGNVTGLEDLSPDEVRRLYESRIEKVSPEYRKQVEQYYRNIMRQKSQDAPRQSTP
jgi:hypothetical protein